MRVELRDVRVMRDGGDSPALGDVWGERGGPRGIGDARLGDLHVQCPWTDGDLSCSGAFYGL